MEISDAGRAPKNDPALFALALACKAGDEATRTYAYRALPRVARIATHLFAFAAFVEQFGGWGQGTKRAVQRWYSEKSVSDVAFQAVKYQQRDGWSHRDLLRLAHPKTDGELNAVLHWIVSGEGDVDALPPVIRGFTRIKDTASPDDAAAMVREYRIPREGVPTQHLTSAAVWSALIDDLPMTALIRNLSTMTRAGFIGPGAEGTATVVAKIADTDAVRRSRLHPITILSALVTYRNGRGVRSEATWDPASAVVDALDGAFYAAFDNAEPMGKRIVVGIDVSGSMAATPVNGLPGLRAREGAGAMSLVLAAREATVTFVAFDTAAYPLALSKRQRLDDVVELLRRTGGGGTDCSIPIRWAGEKKIDADAIVILTDSETWAGDQHPIEAMTKYRKRCVPDAKLVTVCMASNQYTLGPANVDRGCLDVIGLDPATPALIRDFVSN